MKTFREFINISESTEEETVEDKIKKFTENEDEIQALYSLYEKLSDENKSEFEQRLENDGQKLLDFALSKI